MSKVLMLLDGHALVHRAYHALSGLTTSKGEPTNAVYVFTTMLLKAIGDLKPTYIAVAFDRPGPTFRHRQFEAYKAQRAKAPEDLRQQFVRVRQLLDAFHIPVFEAEGYEADDVLGTLASQASQQGIDTVIVTGDTDALQLVGPQVRVLTPRRGFADTVLYDQQAVRQRYGLEPRQLIDFKALQGDPSDNIPGVPGVGEKTARQLLSEYGSVEAILANLEKISPKTRQALEGRAEYLFRNRKLVTIVTDVPLELDLACCRMGSYDRARVVELFRELEFRSLLEKLPAQEAPVIQKVLFDTASVGEETAEATLARTERDDSSRSSRERAEPLQGAVGQYEVVDGAEALESLLSRLKGSKGFAVDVETSGLDAMAAELVGIAVATEPGRAYYVPVGHRAGTQLPMEQVRRGLAPLLKNADLPKYGHNAKYDTIVLSRHRMELRGLSFDTMVAAYLLESSQRAMNLKDVAWTRLGLEMTPITTLIGKGKSQKSMAEVPIDAAARYACTDADATYRLVQSLGPELRQVGLWQLFAEVEMPLVPVLAAMEREGVALDTKFLRAKSCQLGEKLSELEEEIYRAVGHRFNINSTQQLGGVLFEELKLPPVRRTKTGYSTDAEVLEELQHAHPVIGLVLKYRQLGKLKSTYVDALPQLVNAATGRLHTSFNQTFTVTGRLSSSDPNLQNIPIRTDLGRQVRRAFVAGDADSLLLAADYSQIDLRVMAHLSQDESLIAAFANDEDIHTATAAELFGVSGQEVTPEMRRMAKTTNFGIIYGISDYGLATRAGMSRQEAADFIEKYLDRHDGVRRYVEAITRQAESQGYVTTVLGRRRYIPEINASHRAVKMAAERTAINMPIQGTAADIIKLAMIRLHQALAERGLRSKMILQVHDELIFEVPKEELEETKALVRDKMENAYPLVVPLKVDVKVGQNWYEME